MSVFPEIVVGTYEEFILGYAPQKSDEGLELSQSFATHSHQASIRCVAAHGNYLVSSGADEYINIYDLLAKEILTVINFHDATVTCLEFVPDGSHLISANQNGDIAIFRSQDWSLVKYWKKAHKTSNGVNSISVHPTGSLLISTGADNILRFWNLIKGRQAYAVNMSKKCSVGNSLNIAKWSKTGAYYITCIGKTAEVYTTESAAIAYTIECPVKISTVDFTESDVLIVGLDNGLVQIHNIKKQTMMHEEKSHETRIKSLVTCAVKSKNDSIDKLVNHLITADSRGCIKLWRIRLKKGVYSLIEKAQINADCRITCLTTIEYKVNKEEQDSDEESIQNN